MAISNLSTTKQQRLMEYFKCKNDPTYFIEKYIKLAQAGGDTTVPLYDRQKDFIKLVQKDKHVIVLKSRQTGLSTVTQMLCVHTSIFYKNVVIGVVSKSGAESTDFCKKVQNMIDTLPQWLRPEYTKKTEQSYILENGCEFYAAQVNESNPEGLLRGKAITILIIDEAAFIPKIDAAYTSCAPTLFKAQTVASKVGVPFATIIISTPNKTVGKGKWYYSNWIRAVNNDSVFKPFKFHWNMIPELRDDPEWYDQQCKLLENIHWKIAQELDMQFVASNESFLPTETIEILNNCFVEPDYKMRLESNELWQFKKADRNKFYLIGVDTASESGNDFSAIEVVDYETFEQVAEFKGKLRVDEFCRVIKLVTTIYPNYLLVPEANSYGNQVCEYLTKSGTFFNIYQTKIKSKNTIQPKQAKYRYGLHTTPQNRPLMTDALYTYVVDDTRAVVNSERLALELIGLVEKSGKIQADEGENDDLALALAFCAYVKLYDPPMAISRFMANPDSVAELNEIASWNNDAGVLVSPEMVDIKDQNFEGDLFARQEHSNKRLDQYIKKNLVSILENNGGSTIDIVKMLNLRNKKTGPE